MKFVVKLSEDHRGAALKMAGSTEEAGQRMDVALKDLKREFGEFFQPIGAGFQNIIAGMAEMVTGAINTAQMLEQLNMKGGFNERRQELVNQAKGIVEAIIETNKGMGVSSPNRGKLFDDTFKMLLEFELKAKNIKIKPEDLLGTREEWNVTTNNVADQLKKAKESWKNYVTEIKNINEQVKNAFVNAFKGMEDALVNFITKGKLDFRSLAQSIIADITRIFIRRKIMSPLMDAIGFDKWFAKGGVVGKNGIVPFSKGGVVDSPHIFPFKNGIGVMGEAGAESVMPLKRGRDGKLGVIAHGGASNIVVNVDASGSSVEGDGNGGEELGQILAAAIQSELIDQKRPGGILA
jgi:lambda family phage tail tape measure protein